MTGSGPKFHGQRSAWKANRSGDLNDDVPSFRIACSFSDDPCFFAGGQLVPSTDSAKSPAFVQDLEATVICVIAAARRTKLALL
jgi:hypothetical protein